MTEFAKVRGIIFDLDGTLIDSYEAIAESLNHARRAAGMDPLGLDQVRAMVGMGLEVLIARAMGERYVDQGVRDFRAHYDRICVAKTRLLPQVAETLRDLHGRGYRMSVATNKPSYFATRLLEGLGVDGYISAVLGPDVVVNRKPHPEMFLRAMEAMGVAPEETVAVGDMEIDIETARAAGVRVIVLPTGSRSAQALVEARPDILIREFRELLNVLPAASSVDRPGRRG